MAQLIGLEKIKATTLNGATLEVFYLEAYEDNPNVTLLRNASIIFHSSHKLLIKKTLGKFYMLFNKKTKQLSSCIASLYTKGPKIVAYSHTKHYGVSTQLRPSLFSN